MSYYDNDIIMFDVGGKIFKTYRSTLTFSKEETYFTRMMENGWTEAIMTGKPIFIDRNPENFSIILDYFRDYESIDLEYMSDRQLASLRREADYFSISSLIQLIDDYKLDKNQSKTESTSIHQKFYHEILNELQVITDSLNMNNKVHKNIADHLKSMDNVLCSKITQDVGCIKNKLRCL